MVTTLRNMALAAVLAVGATALLSGQASALSMAECSAKFKAAKAAGTDGGMKWNDFRKAQCGTDAAAATDPAPAPAEPMKKMKKTKAAEAPVANDGTKMSMQDCSAAWKQMKANNAVPEGMTWNSFRSGGCVAPAAAPMAKAKMTKPAATAPDATATDAKMSMTECSAAWKQMKANNAVPEGMTWNSFRSGGCKAPAATMAKATAKPGAAAPADTGEKMSMQDCSAAWKQLKASNAVPEGMTWNTFRSGGCKSPADAMAKPKATPVAVKKNASVIPPEPTDQADTTPIPTVDKNGKALTPGRIAAIKRIRACAAQYRQAKATNSMPAEIASLDSKRRWPQFWSQCNTQLKAAGQ